MALFDRLRKAFSAAPTTFDHGPQVRFSGQIPQLLEVFAIRRGGRAGREEALEVPAVLRGRNLICAIGTLPLEAVDSANRIVDHPMLRQPDPNVARSVTFAMTVEDLVFDAVAWWRVTAFGWDGYPVNAVRYDPGQVQLNPPPGFDIGKLPSGLTTSGVVWMQGEPVPWSEVIRFDSPNPAVLVAGRRAILRALALDDAAQLFAENPRMRGYFSPTDAQADPGTDEEIAAALDAWKLARQQRVDGYVPAALRYETVQDPTPADLQLIQLQEKATKDLANALGIDPEELAVSTTTRTYANIVDRRKDRVNDTYAPYMLAITERLSMPDVTKPGVTVRFNLNDYLKADPKTRAEVQQIYVAMGATDAAEVRQEEGRAPREIAAPEPPRRVQATVGEPVRQLEAGRPAGVTFAREIGLTFDHDPDATFAVDVQARTVTGLAVPYGQVARAKGRRWRFARGSIRYSAVNRVKLLRDHDITQAIGVCTSLTDTEDGLVGTWRVSPGARGDEALALAMDGVLDGLSIGVDMREEDFGPDPLFPGASLVQQSALREVSLTAVPSFEDSRLTAVNAAYEGVSMATCPTCGAAIQAGVAHTCPTTPAAAPTPAAAGAAPPPAVAGAAPPPAAAGPVTFSADQFTELLGRVAPVPPAAAGRPTVDPTRATPGAVQVTEALPYRFASDSGRYVFRSDAPHDFSSDLFAVMDTSTPAVERAAAELRVNGLIQAAFADVETADVVALTPNTHRPDLWQPQRDYATPLWDMVGAGTTDGRKFDVPKFTSSSGLVGPATEKTEPAPGAFVAELQTITPSQVWGKVEITRQAWRAGGSPQLSGILWEQMLREYYEDREAAVATFLNTLTAATDITLTGTPAATPDNDDDQVTVNDLEMALADLQFARGGNRFRAFAAHQQLYRVLARVKDDSGRPLYPMLNPSNANGTTERLYSTINIGGSTVVPAYALGTPGATAVNSWLFDPAVVLGWASAPERLFWDFGATVQTANIPQLSFVTLGIYGDVAMANLDIAGVRQVIFDASV